MKKRLSLLLLLAVVATVSCACSQQGGSAAAQQAKAQSREQPQAQPQAQATQPPVGEGLGRVKGGSFVNAKSGYYGKGITIPDFYIGQHEVTQKEWVAVMGDNPSTFIGPELPVEGISWYDAVEYCNKRSLREGLQPYYSIDKSAKDPNNASVNDNVKWTVAIVSGANGYRLPTEIEWEYAAGGGQASKSYVYSGSDDPDEVAWYWRNAGDKRLSGDWNWPAIENNNSRPRAVGLKKPNELGLYDMSGNVREWCWNWYEDRDTESGQYRVVKGGGWIGDISSGASAFRGKFEANGFGPDQGLRVSRSA